MFVCVQSAFDFSVCCVGVFSELHQLIWAYFRQCGVGFDRDGCFVKGNCLMYGYFFVEGFDQ